MSFRRRMIVAFLSLAIATNWALPARACGPEYITPIFVFENSPDLLFAKYTKGTIGIVRPSFGRKSLVIAYRYLNGGSFTQDEQEALIEALDGKPPEEDGKDALKSWIGVRKDLLAENEKLPEIYAERQHENYDFFPNCAKNAFEVANATLHDRIASYGRDDRNVREWLAAQDTVFQNCSGGAAIPAQLGADRPTWLRKDRDYQIAAAFFYSLNFDEARRRFQTIANDIESPWQETARYLIPRALVRQASLSKDEVQRRELYAKAEVDLQNLIGQTSRFQNSARKMFSLVQYHLHPQERAQELGRALANQNGNENLRQDLIDYVWLLDKFEARILEAEKKRREALKPPEERENRNGFQNAETRKRYEALQNGELITIGFAPKKADGTEDYSHYTSIDFKPDVAESEVMFAFEVTLGRKPTDAEIPEIREHYQSALKNREWLISPNRKWGADGMTSYEGRYYDTDHLTLDLVPDFLSHDDLSDWIFTLQTSDAGAYDHAFERWRAGDSPAWLAVALIKAGKSSANLNELARAAQKIERHASVFPTVAHELIRLRIAAGRKDDARKLIDDIISNSFDSLPVSARNEFLGQRSRLAASLTDFLEHSQRRPVAFYDEGVLGRLADLLRIEKNSWSEEFSDETQAEYEQAVEKRYADILCWDERVAFDNDTADIFNWHFPVASLIDASRDRALAPYLQRQMILAAWTRAILLQRDDLARQIAPELMKAAPEVTALMTSYLQAATPTERQYAALFLMLRFPNLSPFVAAGIPDFAQAEDTDYEFENGWWCLLPETEYRESKEVPKLVRKPDFLTPKQLAAAAAERERLKAIGNGKSYIGKLVLQWAKDAPDDPRIPEALFIAFQANVPYKYGCGGWEQDEEVREQVQKIMRERYPANLWTAKLPKPEIEN